jgi:hypothetical protein
MIFSKENKYLFIEIPLTASWAIHHELCNYYGGTQILHKHASYAEFKAHYPDHAKDLFVFAAVRNPLDEIVSQYFKLINNHKNAFSNPESANQLLMDYVDYAKFKFVKDPGVTFAEYFRKFHRHPFGGLLDICSDRYDYVIRYEDLQAGFSEVLNRLNLKQIRVLPIVNKTEGRSKSWLDYYTTDIQVQALRVCGPFMAKWGYELPPEWDRKRLHWNNIFQYKAYTVIRNYYLTNFRYKENATARFVRKLRARFL